MTVADPPVVALVAHARDVPVGERQTFRQRLDAVPRAGLVLETCHRVEAYLVGEGRGLAANLPPGGELLEGERAARHAIAVAAGLDSIVMGEDQILHQVRSAIAEARRDDRLDPALDRLFTLALRAGRRARSWRQGPSPSLADAALAALERRMGALDGLRLLVVGAGEMARLAADGAIRGGATLTIANRTQAHAENLARRHGATTSSFDPGLALASFSGVLVAVRGSWPLASTSADALVGGGAAVVDLSAPPAVPAGVAARLGGRYVSADALATTEPVPPPSARQTSRLTALVEATLEEYLQWVAGRGRRAAAAALAERAEARRRAALDELWDRQPGLEPATRAAIEAMTEHLADRLLREPLERLGRDPDGRVERAARELFAL